MTLDATGWRAHCRWAVELTWNSFGAMVRSRFNRSSICGASPCLSAMCPAVTFWSSLQRSANTMLPALSCAQSYKFSRVDVTGLWRQKVDSERAGRPHSFII
jgi:hypothetical protein